MKTNPIVIEGITWNHSRAMPPLVATAQRFEELNPGVTIRWSKRSLHEFGHADLSALMERFDLVIMDHPWAGYAAKRDILTPLESRVPADILSDLGANSAGPSFASYIYRDTLQALPMDGATPAACRRPDLLDSVPATWDEVLDLARQGRVVMPGFHVDVLLNYLGLCATLNQGRVCATRDAVAEEEIEINALDLLRALAQHLPDVVWDWNPIALYEAMAGHDTWAYCPFAYTYSNYSRRGFCANSLEFCDTVRLPGYSRIRTILGGTGIALSQRCRHPEVALRYMAFTACGEVQQTLYAECGGQPAHRAAWQDETVNALTRNFFANTLPTMDRAVVRPRHDGSIAFQEQAGLPLVRFLREGGDARRTAEEIDAIYRTTRESDAAETTG